MNKELCLQCGEPVEGKPFYYELVEEAGIVDGNTYQCSHCGFVWESHVQCADSWIVVVEKTMFATSPVGCLAVYQWEPV